MRVFQRNRNFIDLATTQPWDVWLEAFRFYQGIAHDKGFIPAASIDMIAHLTPEGSPAPTDGDPMPLPDNVVPLRKPK